MRVLSSLLTPLRRPMPTAEDWWRAHQALEGRGLSSGELALLGGNQADRPAWAFASGYEAALGRVVPGVGARAALCATEAGGAHPAAMATQICPDGDGWRIEGEKGFVTLGTFAERLIVVGSTGEDEAGRKRLRAAVVAADAPGVAIEALPPLPIVPEIPHARVRLDGVRVAELLPGDAWTGLVKPFRTVEDIHVHAALAGWLLRVGRLSRWTATALEPWLAHAASLVALADAPPSEAATHLALGGALAHGAALLEALEPHWAQVDGELHAMWERDRGLLRVAARARSARLDKAREVL